MELSTFYRILLLNSLPEKGSFTTLRIVRELREELSFSEEEHKALKFKEDDDGLVHWDVKGDKPKEFSFGEQATKVITDSLKAISDKGEATPELLTLWDAFENEGKKEE